MTEQIKMNYTSKVIPRLDRGIQRKGLDYPVKLDNDRELTHEEMKILSLLRRGRENAISVKTLTVSTNIPEVEVRAIVRHLIMEHGILIASSVSAPPGFYIASTREEIQTATKSLRHRGIMILVRAAKLQRISVEEIFQQARMEFDEP